MLAPPSPRHPRVLGESLGSPVRPATTAAVGPAASGTELWEDLVLEGSEEAVRLRLWPPATAARGGEASAEAGGSWNAVLLCLHGAGDTALVWASMARHLVADRRLAGIRVVAADLRGHGSSTSTCGGQPEDLCIERLVSDAVWLCGALSRTFADADLVLLGHSLGGSLAARAAAEGLRHTPPLPVRAVALLDAVEGTAVEGFPRTAAWLRARPSSFKSLDAAVAWSISSGMLHSRFAAELSIPSRLRWDEDHNAWVWRAEIAKAAALWNGWFDGLSTLFAGLPLPKMLLVGGIDRLDAPLEAAHMQGRFKLEVIPHQGHQVHEDRPEEVANRLTDFLAGLHRQCAAFDRLRGAMGGAGTGVADLDTLAAKRPRSSSSSAGASVTGGPAENFGGQPQTVASDEDSLTAVQLRAEAPAMDTEEVHNHVVTNTASFHGC